KVPPPRGSFRTRYTRYFVMKNSLTTATHFILLVGLLSLVATAPGQQPAATVRAIPAPMTLLPSEAESAGVTKFSFIAYGDTRSTVDGSALQPNHSALVEKMLATIKRLETSDYPVRFVFQSGDGVTNGRAVNQWNKSFID